MMEYLLNNMRKKVKRREALVESMRILIEDEGKLK